MSVIFAGPEGPGSGRRGPASRVHGTFVSLEDLRLEKFCFRGRKARSGEDLVMSKGRLGSAQAAGADPLDSDPSRPIASWGRQHTSLGAWSYLHHMRVWDPLAGSCMDMPRPRRHAGG
jgi:hypothetical protein